VLLIGLGEDQMERENMKITPSRFAVTAITFAIFTMLATGLANAKGGIPPQCSSVITSCGCTIGASGDYQLGNDLYASQGLTINNGCIDIEGLHINLTVNYNIYGPGNLDDCNFGEQPVQGQKFAPLSPSNFGNGIHILPTAANVAINGTVAEGNLICGWNYGVESETNNVNLYGINTYDNNVGTFLNNATDNTCLFCGFDYNVTGVKISGGSGNSINSSGSAFNSQYGFWVDGSKHTMLTSNNGVFNGLAGFYLGCSSTANVKSQIPCTITTTTGTSVLGNSAVENNKYGFAVERKSFYNNFDGNYSDSNTTKDFIDGNANCVYNNYLDDSFSTKSPSCIQ
jgi:hypothetical protein